MNDIRFASPVAAALLVLGFAPAAAAQSKPANLDKLWTDLASADEATSTRAILALAAAPNDAVALLRDRLKPVRVDADRFIKLVNQMNSPKFAEREAASRELAADVDYLGKFAQPMLEMYLRVGSSGEVQRRVRELLNRISPQSGVGVIRATAILEHIGTTDARKVLESLATGEAEATPTKAAKAALERIKP